MRFPAFMFWPERYWLDTYDLSDAEHGRYLRLLILLWNTPRCHIPNDPAWIASKTGRSVQAFENEIKPLLTRMCETDGLVYWVPWLKEQHLALAETGGASRSTYWKRQRAYVLSLSDSCAYCGKIDENIEIDHIIPRSRGGGDNFDNLAPACRKCNRSKGSKFIAEWIRD